MSGKVFWKYSFSWIQFTIYLPGSLKSKLHVFIKYWVSSVSVIKSILSGISSTLRLSNSSTWRSTLHIWNIKIDGAPSSQQITWDLSIKRVVMEQIGAMKLLAVSLGHGNYVLISSEYLNLGNTSLLQKCEGSFLILSYTSSAISGPLLVKLPCLLTEILVLILPSSVKASTLTASSSSVLWKIM